MRPVPDRIRHEQRGDELQQEGKRSRAVNERRTDLRCLIGSHEHKSPEAEGRAPREGTGQERRDKPPDDILPPVGYALGQALGVEGSVEAASISTRARFRPSEKRAEQDKSAVDEAELKHLFTLSHRPRLSHRRRLSLLGSDAWRAR